MSFENIIKNKYDESTKSLNDILKDHTNYTVEIVADADDNIIDIFSANKKKILTIKYEVMGTYNGNFNIFSWSCDNLIGNKELTNLAKTTKKYSKNIKKLIIDKKFKDLEYMERLYYYLSNNMFFIESANIDDIIKVSLYVVKMQGVVKQNVENVTIFYYVTDIISY